MKIVHVAITAMIDPQGANVEVSFPPGSGDEVSVLEVLAVLELAKRQYFDRHVRPIPGEGGR